MTPKQQKVYKLICDFYKEGGVAPTYSEIMSAMNIKSKSGVFSYLHLLEQQGKIKIHKNKTRGIELTDNKEEKLNKLYYRAKWWLQEIVNNHRHTPISTAEMALKDLEELENGNN